MARGRYRRGPGNVPRSWRHGRNADDSGWPSGREFAGDGLPRVREDGPTGHGDDLRSSNPPQPCQGILLLVWVVAVAEHGPQLFVSLVERKHSLTI